MSLPRLYLDTETTGLNPLIDRIVQIAVIDDDGNVLLDALTNPGRSIPPEATAIHGICDEHVATAINHVTAADLVKRIVRDRDVVIYNRAFDLLFLSGLTLYAASVECAMLDAQSAMGLTRWPRLTAAALWARHDWTGTRAHSALGDCLATRTVYRKCLALRGLS